MSAIRGSERKGNTTNLILIMTGIALFAVAMSNLLIGTPHFLPFSVAFVLVMVGGVIFAIPIVSLGRVDFWSQVLVVSYDSVTETTKVAAAPGEFASTYSVGVAWGHARTQNWETKTEMGRALRAFFDDDAGRATAEEVVERLSRAGPLVSASDE